MSAKKLMSVITKEFVQECLDRSNSDPAELIAKMSEGKEPLDVLLGVIERREKIDWLVNQFEILVRPLQIAEQNLSDIAVRIRR